WTNEGVSDALHQFEKAIACDPSLGAAYGMAAWCYFWRMVNGWMSDRVREIAEANRLARKAVELGPNDAVALTFGGATLGLATSDVEAGLAHIDRALVLNPNLATAWIAGGVMRTNLGDNEAAIEHLSRAMRLSPLDPLLFVVHTFMAFAHFLAGRPDVA